MDLGVSLSLSLSFRQYSKIKAGRVSGQGLIVVWFRGERLPPCLWIIPDVAGTVAQRLGMMVLRRSTLSKSARVFRPLHMYRRTPSKS